MPLHRGFTDEEIRADFLVAFAARQQRQHSQFPAGQGFAAHACCKLFHQRLRYLPRLAREYYQGDAVVHWTLPISHRRQGWLTERFHAAFREMMLHTAAREGLLCPAYCLMPDHLHLVWMGLRLDSDQLNGMAFLRTHLRPRLAPQKFQHQPHDHVLKEEERRRNAFARVCNYTSHSVTDVAADVRRLWPFRISDFEVNLLTSAATMILSVIPKRYFQLHDSRNMNSAYARTAIKAQRNEGALRRDARQCRRCGVADPRFVNHWKERCR